ncbi:MAG TPA: DUF928 domain-containing protein [Myxococcota bacterium]|nr:DUF928 domain-containing protein [Myxococcota bacterium]
MSCPRIPETDFAAFAADRRAPEFAALREHYPRCRDCGGEVARWSRLLGSLREEEGDVSEHPSAERLLAYQSDPDALTPSERAVLEAHVAACAPCRSELRVLAGFDFGALGAPPAREAHGSWLSGLGERLFGRPLTPALAFVALVAIAVPALLLGWWARASREQALPPAARMEPSVPAPQPGMPVLPIPAPQPAEVARVDEPRPPTPPTPTTPAPVRAAPAPPALPSAPQPAPPAEPEASAPVRIAASLPSDPPRYRPDVELAGGSLETLRVASLVRGGKHPLPAIHALAPEHVGATGEAAPTVYWHLSAPSDVPVEIAVFSEEDESVPLLDVSLEPPVAAGLHAFRFSDHALRLAPGRNYYWFVALVPDRAKREDDAVAGAALRHTPLAEPLRARLEASPPAERAHVLAGAGYWFDAFDTFTAWLDAEPGAANLRAQRAALLEQVGLGALTP